MEQKKRSGFSSRWGFILASVGGAVGMGNVWRFPTMVSTYGGLSFLIPYFLFIIIITLTGVVGEIALGRLTKGGPVKAFGRAFKNINKEKLGKGLGIIPLLSALTLAIGYLVVIAWVLKYCYLSFSGNLANLGNDVALLDNYFANSSSGFASSIWILIMGVIVFVILVFDVSKGIEKINKILMPILFAIFIGLGIYIATLPNAKLGYEYIFTLKDPSALLNPKLWVYSFGQAFFSLSVIGCSTIIYGSYMPKTANIKNSSKYIALFDTIASLLATIVIIPAIAFAGAPLDIGGPSLMFVYLVSVLNTLPGAIIIEAIFFVAILFAGVSSIISLLEVLIDYLIERFKLKRAIAALISCSITIIVSIFIQGFTTSWLDFASIYLCPLGALIAGIAFFFLIKRKDALAEINEGSNKKATNKLIALGRYLYCPLTVVVIILGIIYGGIG